jgi:DNA-binding transcriptional LysR family regulator
MRTEDLRYFLAVAATGKLGPASDLTGISQPGLTKAIARLETELGGALFQRTGRGMQLTELGTTFEARATRIAGELSDAMSEARALNPLEGVLRIGVAPSIEPMLSRACARLMAQRPLLRVELTVQITDQLEIAVGGGRLDLAIVSRSKEFAEEMLFLPITHDQVWIVAPKVHPLARAGQPLQLKDLVEQAWALPPRGHITRRHMDEAFTAKGLPPPVTRLENEFSMSAYRLIADCGLLTACTTYTLHMLAHESLQPLNVEDFLWRRQIGVLTRRGLSLAPLAQDLMHLLTEATVPVTAGN